MQKKYFLSYYNLNRIINKYTDEKYWYIDDTLSTYYHLSYKNKRPGLSRYSELIICQFYYREEDIPLVNVHFTDAHGVITNEKFFEIPPHRSTPIYSADYLFKKDEKQEKS